MADNGIKASGICNVEATGVPVAWSSLFFLGLAYCEIGTVTVVEFESFRPSPVQMAPAA